MIGVKVFEILGNKKIKVGEFQCFLGARTHVAGRPFNKRNLKKIVGSSSSSSFPFPPFPCPLVSLRCPGGGCHQNLPPNSAPSSASAVCPASDKSLRSQRKKTTTCVFRFLRTVVVAPLALQTAAEPIMIFPPYLPPEGSWALPESSWKGNNILAPISSTDKKNSMVINPQKTFRQQAIIFPLDRNNWISSFFLLGNYPTASQRSIIGCTYLLSLLLCIMWAWWKDTDWWKNKTRLFLLLPRR